MGKGKKRRHMNPEGTKKQQQEGSSPQKKHKQSQPQQQQSKRTTTMVFDPRKMHIGEGSELFFELANADIVKYRCRRVSELLTIEQDRDIEGKGQEEGVPQTGGIVWETAFLLSMYLLELYDKKNPNRPSPVNSIVEVGAGCGLLGLVLAQEWAAHVTLTDTPTATATLQRNVAANEGVLQPPARAEAKVLRWDEAGDREALDLNSKPELIVGTDVVFTTRLVEPLLASMHAVAKPETVVYLCLQTRCAVRETLPF